MRVAFMSDLHLELADEYTVEEGAFSIADIKPGPELMLLAGDINSAPQFASSCRKIALAAQCPVVAIPGNHCHYGVKWDDADRYFIEQMKMEAQEYGVEMHFLSAQTPSVVIGNTRVVGSTLWTDFELDYGSTINLEVLREWGPDCSHIVRGDRFLIPQDTVERHRAHKAAILAELRKPHSGPTVVMTHHLPIAACINRDRYPGSIANAFFASDLADEIKDLHFDYWVFGHSHDGLETELLGADGKVRKFLTNPFGYPGESTPFRLGREINLRP